MLVGQSLSPHSVSCGSEGLEDLIETHRLQPVRQDLNQIQLTSVRDLISFPGSTLALYW